MMEPEKIWASVSWSEDTVVDCARCKDGEGIYITKGSVTAHLNYEQAIVLAQWLEIKATVEQLELENGVLRLMWPRGDHALASFRPFASNQDLEPTFKDLFYEDRISLAKVLRAMVETRLKVSIATSLVKLAKPQPV